MGCGVTMTPNFPAVAASDAAICRPLASRAPTWKATPLPAVKPLTTYCTPASSVSGMSSPCTLSLWATHAAAAISPGSAKTSMLFGTPVCWGTAASPVPYPKSTTRSICEDFTSLLSPMTCGDPTWYVTSYLPGAIFVWLMYWVACVGNERTSNCTVSPSGTTVGLGGTMPSKSSTVMVWVVEAAMASEYPPPESTALVACGRPGSTVTEYGSPVLRSMRGPASVSTSTFICPAIRASKVTV